MVKRRGIGRRISRGLLRGVIGVAAVGVAVYLASGFFLPAVVRRELSGQFEGAAVSIQGARLSGAGVLIKGLAIAEQESSLADSPIFFAERVWVQFAPGALLGGRRVVRAAVVRDAVLTADYEKGRGWAVSRLGLRRGEGALSRLPLVRIERGALRVRRIEGGQVRPIATVGLDGQIVALGGAGAYGFSLRADDRLALTGSRVDGTLQMGGAGEKSVLTLTGALRMPKAGILGNVWTVDDVGLECAFDAQAVQIRRLGFQMGDGRAAVSGKVGFGAEAGFDVQTQLEGFVLSAVSMPNAVVYSEPVMEMLAPWATDFLRRYRPQGLGDVQLRLQGRWNALGATEITGQVVCRDISVTDTQFPYRLDQMRGAIGFTGRSLTLNRLACRHGDSEFVIDGGVEHFGRSSSIAMRVVSERIRFDEDLYRALGPAAKRMWFAFMPSGTGAIDQTYSRVEGKQTRRLVVELIDAGAVYAHFPYPLEHLTGRLTIEPDAVTLQNIAAHYQDARKVQLDGGVSLSDDGPPGFAVHVRAEQIPVDAALIGAMPKQQRDLFKRLELEATATVDMEIFPDATGQRPMDFTAHLAATGRRLMYSGFAVPLEDVRIVAEVTPEAVELKELTGRRGQGRLSLSGRIVGMADADGGPGVCLDVKADGFELDEAFWAAAGSAIKPLPPAIRLAGPVTAKGRWSRNMPAGQCDGVDMEVVCQDNPVLIEGRAAAYASGTLRVEPGRVRLDGFQLDQVELTERLAVAMPKRMQEAYRRLGVTGWVNAAVKTATLTLEEEGFGGMEMVGSLTLGGLKSETSDLVENLMGVVEGRFRLDGDEQVQEAEGDYQMAGFRVRGRTVDRLAGRLAYDPNTGVLASRGFTAELCDGTAAGTATVDIRRQESFLAYTLGLTFEGIEVGDIVAPQESSDEGDRVRQGKAEGLVDLQGRLGQAELNEGRMTLTVSKMRLGKQTLIGKALTAIQFRQPQDYVFDRMEVEAFLMGDEIVCDRIRTVGRPFVFHGDGRLNLKTQRIEMNLVAWGGSAAEPSFLDSMLRGLGSAFWKIEIRGDMRQPEINTVSLPILQFPLELLKR